MNSKPAEGEVVDLKVGCEELPPTFVEPKLTFLKPELQKQGSLENLTKQGFFGIFPGLGS